MSFFLISSSLTINLTAGPTVVKYPMITGSNLYIVGITTQAITATRLGGTPTFNGIPMLQPRSASLLPSTWYPYSASNGEANEEIFFLIKPRTGITSSLSIPNTGGSTMHVCQCNVSTSKGFEPLYITSSVSQSAGGTAATSSVQMRNLATSSTNPSSIFTYAAVGAGHSSPSATWNQQKLQSTDIGAYQVEWYVQSQSSFSPLDYQERFGSTDDSSVSLLAFGERSSSKTYSSITDEDEPQIQA